MLPPHELQNKTFTRAIRGYTTTEVDEHIDFLISQYTELYRENDELERKYRTALAELDKFRGDEESIRTALVNAKKAGAKITRDANRRSEIVLRSAKANCDRILSEFHEKIVQEKETLTKLQEASRAFKAMLVSQYGEQIARIEELTDTPEGDDIPDDEYIRSIVASIKTDVTRISMELETEAQEEPAEALLPAEETPVIPAKDEGTVELPPELIGLAPQTAEEPGNEPEAAPVPADEN